MRPLRRPARPARRPLFVESLEARRLFDASFDFLVASQAVSNASGTVEVVILRGDDTSGSTAINFYTSNGTATAGTDYTAVTNGMWFHAGETMKSVFVNIADRPYAPAAQDFTLTLWAPSAGSYLGTTTVHTVTLQNDRAPVSLAAPAYTRTTDDTGVDFVVTRAGNTAIPVSVDYATANGSATAGSDYTAASGTLNFAAGETSTTVHVPLLSNRDAAGGVTFDLSLLNPSGGAVMIGTSSATVTLTNSYSPVQLDAASYSTTTGDEFVSVTVTRTGNTSLAASVNYATSAGTAVADTDYLDVSGTLSFAAGETSRSFEIPVAGNVEAAGDVGLTVALSAPGGAAVLGVASSAPVTIANPFSPLRFDAATYDVSTDDATVTLTVNRTGNLSVAATVDYATGDLSAIAAVDYAAVSGTLSFAPGESSQDIEVTLEGNVDAADGLMFEVVLSGGTGGAVLEAPADAKVVIANDHVPLQLDASSYTYSTDDDTATLTVKRTGNSAVPVSVQYATADGSALAGTHYAAASGTLHFSVGEMEETIDVPLLHRYDAADGLVFGVTLSAPGGGAELGAVDSVPVAITNLRSLVEIGAPAYAVDVRLDTVTVQVVRAGNTSLAAAVDYATVDGTAVDGEDYFGASGTLLFDPGQTTQFIEISVIGDASSPASRGFTVALSAPGGNAVIGDRDTVPVDIQNTESVVQFASADYFVSSTDGAATLTLTRVGNTSVPLTVDYATADGTALDGRDYTAGGGTVTFAGGQASRTVSVPVLVNPSGAAAVTFTVGLSNPTGGLVGATAGADVEVRNNYAVVEFDVASTTVSNDNAAALLLVRRTGNTSLPGSVQYATFSETAVAGTDYAAASGVLSFAAGEAAKSIPVSLLGNHFAPAGRVFGVTISGGTGAAVVGDADTTRVTVTNFHSVVAFAGAAYTANESDGVVTFTLSRAGNVGPSVSVNFVTSDGSATAGADYGTASGTVTFGAGEATATFAVTVNSDLVFDPNEVFGVTLIDPAGGAVLGASKLAVVTLTDTTPAPTFSGGGLVSVRRPGRLDGVTIAFDQELQAPPAEAFGLFQRSGDQSGGVARLKPVAITGATYDTATHAVTVHPVKALKAGVFYQLSVNADLVHNAGGKKLDGAGTGQEGSPLVVTFGRGKRLKYVDQDGDTVQLSLRGPGVIELLRRADGEGERLTLSGATAATKLLGTVRPGRLGGDGTTTLGAVAGLGAATNLLSAAQFDVDEIE